MTNSKTPQFSTELVEKIVQFVRSYPTTKRVQVTVPEHEDITSMGSPYMASAYSYWTETQTTFVDCAEGLRATLNSIQGTDND